MEKAELFRLVERGDVEGLARALDEGGEAKSRDGSGVSLLQVAAGKGDLAIVTLLLQRGAEPDRSCDACNTPLMAAAAKGSAEVVAALLQAGAAPGHANRWGLSAGHWAKWAESTEEILSLLRAAQRA